MKQHKDIKLLCIVIILFLIIDTFVFDVPLFWERVIQVIYNIAIIGAFIYEIFFCERYVGYYQKHKIIVWICFVLLIGLVIWSTCSLLAVL